MAKSPQALEKSAVPASAPPRPASRTTPAGRPARTPSPRRAKVDFRSNTELFINRELSWVDFNFRVLALASSSSLPLLERVKFLSICSTNLDEFFMVRVAGLKELQRTGTRKTSADGLNPDEQIDQISKRVRELTAQQSRIWSRDLRPQLAAAGISVVGIPELTPSELRSLKKYFMKQVFPVLTPLAVDPAHPFPHLPNRNLSICVTLDTGTNGRGAHKPLYALVEVPQVLPRFVPLKAESGCHRLILLGDVIAHHLPLLFANSRVISSFEFRVTRDSDLEIDEEEAQDLLTVIEAELRQRQWGNVVRLEVSTRALPGAVEFLRDMLEVDESDVIPIDGPLHYGDFMDLHRLDSTDKSLRYVPYKPLVRPEWRQQGSIFRLIRQGDLLAHHPYESFSCVTDFVEAAANDPHVLAIKLTLYRTSPESPIVKSLIRAANNGKQVVALVELKARFDEANNIQWARLLEREGVHVVYGFVGLKTHCKACLVVRREGKILRRYCHLSTGNYNPTTAAMYTDLSLFTTEQEMTEDVASLFNMLTGFSSPLGWKRLVLSPNTMHERLIRLIRTEMQYAKRSGNGRIVCKMNALVEPAIIAALYEASCAGVKIDLIVRGICALRPGIPGVSENIRVTSIVGRYLEHSRAFYFHQGGKEVLFLSSADWMQRNFFTRIETMFPVDHPPVRQRILDEVLGLALDDNVNSWELRSDGTWKRRTPPVPSAAVDSQRRFMEIETAIAAAAPPVEITV